MKAAKGKESNLVQGPQDMVDLKYDDFISMYSLVNTEINIKLHFISPTTFALRLVPLGLHDSS